MSKKRLTRAEAQHGLDVVTDRIQRLDTYAAGVQADVRAELGAIPPQHERVTLENDEQLSEHYKKVTRILTSKAEKDVEALVPEADILKSAERLLAMRTAELERLKLEKADPELDERQWQMLSDLKSRLLEYPALLAEVTGDDAFLQNIKKSYGSKLEELEETLDKLTDDVFGLESACAAKIETALLHFAEDTMKPAISIVSAHHEKLQRELDEAEEESEQLKERIEMMKVQAEDAGTEKERLGQEHQAREESLTNEIAELKKMLDTQRDVNKTQNEEHKRETADLKARHEKARTIAAEEARSLRANISSYTLAAQELNEEKDELEVSVKYWREQNDSRREEHSQLKARLRSKEGQLRDAEGQVDALKEELQSEKDEVVVMNEKAEQEKESLRNELKAVKEARNSAEAQIQSINSQLSTAKTEIDSLKQSSDRQVESLNSELSAVKDEKESISQSWKSEVLSLQGKLSTAESEKESLKHSSGTEIQSLRNELSSTKDDYASLVNSKQELEILHGRATKISDQMTRLLQWHISALDNVSMGELESGDVLREMGEIVGTMERYAGPTTGAVSMPKHVTLVWKATAVPELNLAAARQLWLSSRRDSLLDVARAFFMQQEITSAQFALLPWIHAFLNRTVITMCESSTVTPDLASALLCILQGLVYTATVAREWSDHAWIPTVEEMLTKINNWLGEHIPNDEASILIMVANQVNDFVNNHESTSISPKDFEESQRIDSTNSDIPNGMALVFDKSGMIILFTADNAFVFGASEMKVVEFDSSRNMVLIFESQAAGLPENLREIRLHNCGQPNAVIAHKRLFKSVVPKGLVVGVSVTKYLE